MLRSIVVQCTLHAMLVVASIGARYAPHCVVFEGDGTVVQHHKENVRRAAEGKQNGVLTPVCAEIQTHGKDPDAVDAFVRGFSGNVDTGILQGLLHWQRVGLDVGHSLHNTAHDGDIVVHGLSNMTAQRRGVGECLVLILGCTKRSQLNLAHAQL